MTRGIATMLLASLIGWRVGAWAERHPPQIAEPPLCAQCRLRDVVEPWG